MVTPKPANPKPATNPINGTSSIPAAGSKPKANPTNSGASPYTPARTEIHSISAVISSSTSTGAARIASYVRWNCQRTNVLNIPGNAEENSTATATTPVATYCTYFIPATCGSSEPKPSPKASR